jgi:hypothetical protein
VSAHNRSFSTTSRTETHIGCLAPPRRAPAAPPSRNGVQVGLSADRRQGGPWGHRHPPRQVRALAQRSVSRTVTLPGLTSEKPFSLCCGMRKPLYAGLKGVAAAADDKSVSALGAGRPGEGRPAGGAGFHASTGRTAGLLRVLPGRLFANRASNSCTPLGSEQIHPRIPARSAAAQASRDWTALRGSPNSHAHRSKRGGGAGDGSHAARPARLPRETSRAVAIFRGARAETADRYVPDPPRAGTMNAHRGGPSSGPTGYLQYPGSRRYRERRLTMSKVRRHHDLFTTLSLSGSSGNR